MNSQELQKELDHAWSEFQNARQNAEHNYAVKVREAFKKTFNSSTQDLCTCQGLAPHEWSSTWCSDEGPDEFELIAGYRE